MIQGYLTLAGRIRLELGEIEQVVSRAERAMRSTYQNPQDQDLYIDSVALSLHDFYAGLERIFQQIGSTVDGSIPTGREWHRNLLRQMGADVIELRPPVLSTQVVQALDEYMRFRHVVRNIYAFQFDPERIERLVNQMRPTFVQAQSELFAFSTFLEQVGRDE